MFDFGRVQNLAKNLQTKMCLALDNRLEVKMQANI
jgi:hypothetical protein